MRSISPGCAFMIAVLSLLVSCGGGSPAGSGGAAETDFASITVAGGGTFLYTETTSTVASSGYSPYLSVVSDPSPSFGTYLYSLDWEGADYVTRFEIHVWGSGPGTYSIIDANSLVYFVPAGGPTYSAMTTAAGSSGTITFTEFGGSGGRVKGTFDVISLIVGSPSLTAHLTGSFSVYRY
ncbi:MAG: hypothetical protein AABZ15_12905 [Nitrospirota bacterium]